MTSQTYDILNTLKRNLATLGTNLAFAGNNKTNLAVFSHEIFHKVPKLNWNNLSSRELFDLGFTKINSTNRWFIPSYLYRNIPIGTTIYSQPTNIPITVKPRYTVEKTADYIPFKINSVNMHNLVYAFSEKNAAANDSFLVKYSYYVTDSHFNITLLNANKATHEEDENLISFNVEIGKSYDLTELINSYATRLINKNISLGNFVNVPNSSYISNPKSKLAIKLAVLNHKTKRYEIS